MCRFITATLPATAQIAALDALARAHGKQLRPLANPSVQRHLAPCEAYFLTTLGHCDCDAPLGWARRSRTTDWDEEARKLARKGWSTAKVARALAQKREQAEVDAQVEARRVDTAMAKWVAFIDAVLGSGQVRELGLLLHHYSGPLDEDIRIRERRPVRVGAALPEVLRDLDEDVLYLVHA
ncbi:hypothetical protein FB548_2390 [Pseudoxanthomonas sp. 3HH-4]|uniref:hypothetical protein n=1 Tax=Pseudoxanthomonas sp. 3HH-4 TaxID=1690214 RepID=UPI00114D9FD0|nr:hypothetical protein [Pseudoxanthomonas sp. 3HH-4]TQM12456.1 hypothetical protein FB548_2390 [Pseudoxanthomonas sp. 3HH-4]